MAVIRSLFVFAALCVVCHPANGSIASWWKNVVDDVTVAENAVEGEAEALWKKMKEEYGKAVNQLKYMHEKNPPERLEETQVYLADEAHGSERKRTDTTNSMKQDVENVVVPNGCECSQYTCGCCKHLEEPRIELNSTLCANATYLSEDIGISLTVTVNKYAIFNETVSVRNPPPVCLGVPYVKEWAEACIRLYDIDATRTSLHACAEVEARMKHVLLAKYELGCFNIGPRHKNNNPLLNNGKDAHESQPVVMLV